MRDLFDVGVTGVLGETPQIFPAASDYHLVCLQHDDSAEMIIDGMSLLTRLAMPAVYNLTAPTRRVIPERQ